MNMIKPAITYISFKCFIENNRVPWSIARPLIRIMHLLKIVNTQN